MVAGSSPPVESISARMVAVVEVMSVAERSSTVGARIPPMASRRGESKKSLLPAPALSPWMARMLLPVTRRLRSELRS